MQTHGAITGPVVLAVNGMGVALNGDVLWHGVQLEPQLRHGIQFTDVLVGVPWVHHDAH